jgi:hypothetical protein
VVEESSLVIYISLKATWGTLTSPNLCGFYDEFKKNVKQASARAQIKQPVPNSQKPSEEVKESPLPPPSPSLSSSPPPALTPKISLTSLPRGKIIWVCVNLREVPGIQYRIIGKAYMKNTFEILAENPGWIRVRLGNGAEGWMIKKATESLMTPSSQSPPASSDDSSKTRSPSKRPCPI